MVNVVDYLLAQGVETQRIASRQSLEELRGIVPASIQQMLEKHIDCLNVEDQQVLEVASVVGAEFSAAAVAAGIKRATGEVEACCTRLARREQFLRASGVSEWPDGTVATRYGFLHALYQEVLYERVPMGQRIDLHRQIGEQLETAYGKGAKEIAAELAVHFERGHEYRRAVQYCRLAGENAPQRSAHREAISHLTKGLELLKLLPDNPEHVQQELALQVSLGPALMVTKGTGAPEVGKAYARARELCRQIGETPQLFPILRGLWDFYAVRAECKTAQELAEQLLSPARSAQDPSLLLEAHQALGQTLQVLGEWAPALEHFERLIALYDPQRIALTRSFMAGMTPE